MIILTIRTDKPESEIGLYDGRDQLTYVVWEAHRQLAETIHIKLREMLESQGLTLQGLSAVVCYKGPGSFTGLRIGLSVANALAYSLNVPIVGIEGENNWVQDGIGAILDGQNDIQVMPEYGAPVHITKPKN